ncbi:MULTISPECIES: aminotransferase class I/II-fold pyridoxal phosphate-dependent enzyme [Saccharibacillus]|uniref:aminotransferase class I/II-fold pyridoxal phosphate-dependent enzyme n=1 Tax=Saccharibacillus TaxID=456492 RepID=UPI00301C0FCF
MPCRLTLSSTTRCPGGRTVTGSGTFVSANAARAGLERFLNYHDPADLPGQKEAALRWMRPLGIRASAERVAIVSGAQNALVVTRLALFEPGSRIAVDTHTYSNFIELAKSLRIKLVPVAGDCSGMLPGARYRRIQKVAGARRQRLVRPIFPAIG